MTVQLLIHSTEPLLVRGLESILCQEGGFQLRPSCATVDALRDQLTHNAPDVALLEPGPEVNLAFLSHLKQASPAKVVLWVDSISPQLAVHAMTVGVRGILRKSLSPRLQVECLRKVGLGEVWFEKVLVDNLGTNNRSALTQREQQVLELLSQGLMNREIAKHLAVSEGTVKAYLTRLLQKLGARDRFELALLGLKASLGRRLSGQELHPKEYALS